MRSTLFWLAFGLLLPQALWTKRITPRFDAAAGACSGEFGSTRHHDAQPIELIGVGDSIIAGVGPPHQEQALVYQTAHALTHCLDCRVHWQAHGKIGAQGPAIAKHIDSISWPAHTDVVLISVGVNDLLALTSIRAWGERITALIARVRDHSPTAWIVFCGLPPLALFPALPKPLAWVLGWRAQHFNRVLLHRIAKFERVLCVGIEGEVTQEDFADDGFHPGVSGCHAFGILVAEALTDRIKGA